MPYVHGGDDSFFCNSSKLMAWHFYKLDGQVGRDKKNWDFNVLNNLSENYIFKAKFNLSVNCELQKIWFHESEQNSCAIRTMQIRFVCCCFYKLLKQKGKKRQDIESF